MHILCGVAIGYPDPQFPANDLSVPRNRLEENFVFKDGVAPGLGHKCSVVPVSRSANAHSRAASS
jgi:hypothetical protein